MKLNISISLAAVVLVTAGTIVAAAPFNLHKHDHRHDDNEKRSPATVTITTNVFKSTTIAYDVNGHFEPESVVCKEIADGRIVLPTGVNVPLSCSFSGETPHTGTPASHEKSVMNSTPTPTATASVIAAAQQPTSAPVQIVSSTIVEVGESSTKDRLTTSLSHSSKSAWSTSNPEIQLLEKEFPDAKLDCGDFPSDYGAIEIPWMGIGGWSGVQYPIIEGDTVTHIDTAVPGGKNCTAGAMCSYACPAGYQKSQWPSAQGSTGQSVGGLLCNQDNKLALTNPGLSKNLCIKGTGATKVKNQLKANAAICRTDYPG